MPVSIPQHSEETPLTGADKPKNPVGGRYVCILTVACIALATLYTGSYVFRQHKFVAPVPDTIGLPGHVWLNISLEIEMKSRTGSIDLAALLPKVQQSLGAVPIAASTTGQRMWQVTTKSDHNQTSNKDVMASSWQWENEMPASSGIVELSSPIDLSEQEAEIAIMQSASLVYNFHTAGSAQVNVDARCLRQNELRLVGLLLIWERFDAAIGQLAGHRDERLSFAALPLAQKNPQLLAHLQQLWKGGAIGEPLADVYNRFAQYSKLYTYASGGVWERDGWRDFAVNVCHLLHVDCTHTPTAKNTVPKFGALEFRAFDSVVGGTLRVLTMLVVRLVQASCDMPLDAMTPLMLLPGVSAAPDLTMLLQFLHFEPSKFYGASRSGQFLL